MTASKPYRAAIVGCGHFARKSHAACLAALPSMQLVGFCDQQIENAVAFNQQFAGGTAQVYASAEELFGQVDLDIVHICLPPFAHSNEVELACRHGVHFLIEKPIALTLDLAWKMVEQVRESGVKSQVGFMWRHGQAVRQVREYLRTHEGGAGGYISARYFCHALHRPWWRDRSKSGGQLVEQIIHLLDLTRYLLGEPVRVYSMQDNLFHRDLEDYTAEDASGTVIRFASGGIAVVAATNGAIPNRWESDVRICLPGLTADLVDANNGVLHHTNGDLPATMVAGESDLYLAETLDLLAAICDDRPTAAPIEEGFRSLRLALAAARSAELDAPVDIPLT
ncbi:MAG: Gfo/Idh/MocA family protein [Anaerolineae bacterium]